MAEKKGPGIDVGDAIIRFIGDLSDVNSKIDQIQGELTRELGRTSHQTAQGMKQDFSSFSEQFRREVVGALKSAFVPLTGLGDSARRTGKEFAAMRSHATDSSREVEKRMLSAAKSVRTGTTESMRAIRSMAEDTNRETRELMQNMNALSTAFIRATSDRQKAMSGGESKPAGQGWSLAGLGQGILSSFFGFGAYDMASRSVMKLRAEIGEGIAKAAAFERTMANVRTIVDESRYSVDALAVGILNLNPALGDATQLAEGLYEAISSGIAPEKAVAFIETVARFSRGSLSDMASSVRLLTSVLNAYGIETERAEEVSDVLFTTVNLGVVRGQELAQSFGRVTPVAAALNVPLREVSALLSTLTRGGLDCDEAITALRATMMEFLNPSKAAREKAAELGVEIGATAVKTKGFTQAMIDLAKASKGDQEATAIFFDNVRALTGVLSLTGKQAGTLAEIMAVMNDETLTAGQSMLALEKQTATLSAQFDRSKTILDRWFQGFALNANVATGVMRDIGDALDKLLARNPIELQVNVKGFDPKKNVLEFSEAELQKIKEQASSGSRVDLAYRDALLAKTLFDTEVAKKSGTTEQTAAFDRWVEAVKNVRKELEGAGSSSIAGLADGFSGLKVNTESFQKTIEKILPLTAEQKKIISDAAALGDKRIEIENRYAIKAQAARDALKGQNAALQGVLANYEKAKRQELDALAERQEKKAAKDEKADAKDFWGGLRNLETIQKERDATNEKLIYLQATNASLFDQTNMYVRLIDLENELNRAKKEGLKYTTAQETLVGRILEKGKGDPLGTYQLGQSGRTLDTKSIEGVAAAFRALGTENSFTLAGMVNQAEAAFDRIAASGMASSWDLLAAEQQIAELTIQLYHSMGLTITADMEKEYRERASLLDKHNRDISKLTGKSGPGADGLPYEKQQKSLRDLYKETHKANDQAGKEMSEFTDIALEFGDAMAQAAGSGLAAWISGTGSFGEAINQMLAQLAQYWMIRAIGEMAEGFACLFWRPAEAATHFKAAAGFGAAAAAAGLGGRAIGGGGGGAGSSSGSTSEYSRTTPETKRDTMGNTAYTATNLDYATGMSNAIKSSWTDQQAASRILQEVKTAQKESVIPSNYTVEIRAMDAKSFVDAMKTPSSRAAILNAVETGIKSNKQIRKLTQPRSTS